MPGHPAFTITVWLLLSYTLLCDHGARGLTNRRLKGGAMKPSYTGAPLLSMRKGSYLIVESENNKNRIGNDEKKKILKDMISVALPALAACIVEPLLTIVDSFCIGQYMSTLESTLGLAGLSVNGAIFNILAAATYPLCTATTALVSDSMGKMEAQRDTAKAASSPNDVGNETASAELKSIFVNGIFLAVVLGSVVSSFLITCSNTILKLVVPDLDVAVAIEAIKYLRIRALSVPSVLMNNVLIGYSLGIQNGIGPMISISLAFLTNVIGDIICIGGLKMGLTGAALATTVSSYVGSMIALIYMSRKYVMIKNFSLRSGLDVGLLRSFARSSGRLFTGAMLNMLTYSGTSRVASFAGFADNSPPSAKIIVATSTVDIAAHQISMQLWWFLSFFSSVFSLVAQSLLPRDISSSQINRVREIMYMLTKISVTVGAACTLVNGLIITHLPSLFTKDTVVQIAVSGVLPQILCSQFFICVATVFDGMFIGSGRLTDYVGAGIISTFAAWTYFVFFAMKYRLGLVGAWNGLLIFSLARLLYWIIRFPSLAKQLSLFVEKSID